jgi:hypothetical protein
MNPPKCSNPKCNNPAIILIYNSFYCGDCAVKIQKRFLENQTRIIQGALNG